MATRAQKVRLSIFLIISCTILLAFFITLVGSRLMRRVDRYYIEYRDISITGLEPGAAVKFRGVQVGRVTRSYVKDAATVVVEIEVERGTPIKRDAEAILTLVGITGLKFVELTGGSPESENLPVGGTIEAGKSVFETISGRAEVMIMKLEQVLNNLNVMLGPKTTESLQSALVSIKDMTMQVNTFLNDNSDNFSTALAHLDTLTIRLISAAENIEETTSSIAAIAKSGEIDDAVKNVAYITGQIRTQLDSLRLAETVDMIRKLAENSNTMVVHYDLIAMKARDDILRSMSSLEEALDNLREATDVIRDNPSVLLRGRQISGDRVE